MITDLLWLPTKIFRYAIIVQRSNYKKVSDKFDIYFTLLSLFIKTVIFGKKTKNVSQSFFKYKVYGGDYATLFSQYREIFVAEAYRSELDEQYPKIIDCGANIGMAVLYFKKCYPGSSIIAFEPSPIAFELLQKNISENKLKNVVLHNIGLSDKKGTLDFYLGDLKGNPRASIFSSREGGKNKIVIQTGKLSEYIGKDKVNLIKIDVEGSESEIVNDLLESGLLKSTQEYQMEYHHNISGRPPQLGDFLKKFENSGFNYYIKSDDEKTQSSRKKVFQTMIIYFYRNNNLSTL